MSPLLLLSSFIYFDLVFFFLFLFLVPSMVLFFFFFFSSRRRHTRWTGDWSSDVCSSDLPGHAGQPGPPVDLHRARPALAGLAVPPDGQVAGLGGLQPVQHVQDDLALVHLDLVVGELTGARVPAPDPEGGRVAHQCFSSATLAL